jgi:hypothetical protein
LWILLLQDDKMARKPEDIVGRKNDVVANDVIKMKEAVAREEFFWAEECLAPPEQVWANLPSNLAVWLIYSPPAGRQDDHKA